MINTQCSSYLINLDIFVTIKLMQFDKIFESSVGVFSLLANQSIDFFTSRTCHFMFSGDFVNLVTLKIEFLYAEGKHFHFITFLVSRCKLV